ncbi:phosphomevalonate kinase, partial [Modicella reniformis]
MSTNNTTIVSAPGKVLLAGGYLVLDPAFSGLVIATDARFYTLIRPRSHSHTSSDDSYTITVRSPQFENATWNYHVNINDKDIQLNPSEEDQSKNTFVELALVYSLAIVGQLMPSEKIIQKLKTGLEIVIAGNNDFYSQRQELKTRGLQLNTESLKQIPLFSSTHTTLSKVNKTGLGSSAALITSLVSAVFIHFGICNLQQSNPTTDVQLLHNVAQFVHCLAQGKVGSGFDVSSAVWGSHTYRRFSPEILQDVMHHDARNDIPTLLKVLDPTQTTWDNVVTPFQLAPRLHLMLADIDAGSHTPTLVSNVLKWRKNLPEEANALWTRLGTSNDKVVELLKKLDQTAKKDPISYDAAIEKASVIPASEWAAPSDAATDLLVQIYGEFSIVRGYLREMSRLSQVPVEPEEQTRLLDACLTVPGVLMAGVPGDKSKKSVETVWSGFKDMSVGPLLCKQSAEGGLLVELGTGHGDDKAFSEQTSTSAAQPLPSPQVLPPAAPQPPGDGSPAATFRPGRRLIKRKRGGDGGDDDDEEALNEDAVKSACRDKLTEMLRGKIRAATAKRLYQDEATRDNFLKGELDSAKQSYLGRPTLPRQLLTRAVDIRAGPASPVANMEKAKKKLGTSSDNLKRWKEVVNSDIDMVWEEQLEAREKEMETKAVEAAKKRAAAKGKGRAKNGNGDGGGGGGAGDGGGDGDGDGSGKELRTCTATLKQIMRADLRESQSDGETGYQKVLSLLERKQKEITNIEEEVSILVQKAVLTIASGKVYGDAGLAPTTSDSLDIRRLLPDDFVIPT